MILSQIKLIKLKYSKYKKVYYDQRTTKIAQLSVISKYRVQLLLRSTEMCVAVICKEQHRGGSRGWGGGAHPVCAH